MKRRIFNAMATVSFAILIAIVAIWVRSYTTKEEFRFRRIFAPADPREIWTSFDTRLGLYLIQHRTLYVSDGRISFAVITSSENGRPSFGPVMNEAWISRNSDPNALVFPVDNYKVLIREGKSATGFNMIRAGKHYMFPVDEYRQQLQAGTLKDLKWSGSLPHSYAIWTIPFWAITCVAAVIPAWWIALFIGRWRERHCDPSHCRVCGYDLRGNLAAVTCPECGAAFTAPNRAATPPRPR